MPDLTMGLAKVATSLKADQLQQTLGIKTLKKALDTRNQVAGQLLEELGRAAYAAIGKGQNVDMTV